MAAARAVSMGGGVKIGSAGTHLFAMWKDQRMPGHPRYVSAPRDRKGTTSASPRAAGTPNRIRARSPDHAC